MSDSLLGRLQTYTLSALGSVGRILAGVLGLILSAILAVVAVIAIVMVAVGLAMLVTGAFFAGFGYIALYVARRGIRR